MSGSAVRPAVAAELGRRIRELRTGLGLTVEALAERSDVSRRMLTQVELGQANPSVATVDRIAAGLGTTLADLTGVSRHEPPHGVQVWSSGGSWAYLLSAVETGDSSVELWRWRLVEGEPYTSDAVGPETIVHVLEGVLVVTKAGAEFVVPAGESVRLPAGRGYVARAGSAEPTVFLRVVPWPKGSAPAAPTTEPR